jgi:hypothetical protein
MKGGNITYHCFEDYWSTEFWYNFSEGKLGNINELKLVFLTPYLFISVNFFIILTMAFDGLYKVIVH